MSLVLCFKEYTLTAIRRMGCSTENGGKYIEDFYHSSKRDE